MLRSDSMRPNWCSGLLGYRARMGVGSSGGGCVVGGVDRGGMCRVVGVMLGVMSSVTMFCVMASVMTMMTSGPVTEGEAD